MTVLCISEASRPNEIPLSKWIKKGVEYTVLEAIRCNAQGGLLGYRLAEIDLKGCEPYLYFAAWRFALPALPEVMEEVEELTV